MQDTTLLTSEETGIPVRQNIFMLMGNGDVQHRSLYHNG